MKRYAALAILACLAASCGKKVVAPPAGDTPLPPLVEEVHPAPRASGVLYDTDIWVRFSAALDPATVNERNVFLKVDTERMPIDLAWEPDARRIRIAPRALLRLRRTYTIELTGGIAAADGTPLGQTLFSQFTTNGLRRLAEPLPESGATLESPFATLLWRGTEPEAGAVRYVVYAGTDSAAVAAHAVPPLESRAAHLVPRARWPLGAAVYWTVHAVNESVDEALDGPVWRFDTLPAGTPVDSVDLYPSYWGSSNTAICNGSILCGGTRRCAIHWPFENLPDDARLAGCVISMIPSATSGLAERIPKMHAIAQRWDVCEFRADHPLAAGDPLALGVYRETPTRRYDFRSDTLTAFIEAIARRPGFYGFTVAIGIATGFPYVAITPVKVYTYRLPAAAPAPVSASGPSGPQGSGSALTSGSARFAGVRRVR